jgi:TPR repeat protein
VRNWFQAFAFKCNLYRYIEAAAANGDELAAFNLGYMHMKGLSVPQNFTEARKRFDAAIAKVGAVEVKSS